MAEEKKKKGSLKRKVLTWIIVLGISVTLASVLCGIFIFKHEISEVYNTEGYQIAATTEQFYGDDMKRYTDVLNRMIKGEDVAAEVEEIRSSERYKEIHDLQETLRRQMEVNDIYVCVVDYDNLLELQGVKENGCLYYVMDCYYMEEEEYAYGHVDNVNLNKMDIVEETWRTGIRTDSFIIINGKYGYNTTAFYPVLNEEGKTIAAIGVEVPMSTLQTDMAFFMLRVSLVSLIVVILIIWLMSASITRRVITPIKLVSDEAGHFVRDNAKVSEVLPTIKTNDELQTLSEDILKMETEVKAYIENIKNITAEKERIGAELSVATNIQASMLPCIFPPFPDRKELDIYATMNPAKEVGGDFYDFFMVDDSHLAIVVADVSGKGVPAALFMVIGKTLIKDHTMPGEDLGQVFSDVNNILCESNSEELFITAYEAVIDLRTGEVVFVNAGHEHPFIMTTEEDGRRVYTEMKPRAGMVLAGMEGIKYKSGTFTMKPGDRLMQYTDGVTEATNAQNELYGMERLTEFLNSHTDLAPTDLLPALREDINGFVKEAPQFDDITMLCFEFKEYMTSEKPVNVEEN